MLTGVVAGPSLHAFQGKVVMPELNENKNAIVRHVAGRHSTKRADIVPGSALKQALFEILNGTDMPLGAYPLAAELRKRGLTVPMPSIYRALSRMVSEASIERVETLSAYRTKDQAKAVLMICQPCGRTTSLAVPSEFGGVLRALLGRAFRVAHLSFEAIGSCLQCSVSSADHAPCTLVEDRQP